MKCLIIAFLAVTIMNGPVINKTPDTVARVYSLDVADILDPSFPKLA